MYNLNKFDFRINNTILLNQNFNGDKITDNYLVVVNMSLKSNLKNVYLFLKDFSLDVGEASFHIQNKYELDLVDIGITYDENVLDSDFKNYIFVFEIPEKYIKSELFFVYNAEGEKTYIRLDQQSLVSDGVAMTNKLNDELSFAETLGNITFNINSYEIKEKFLINYTYCVSNDDCLVSKEYIKASINQNFDKYVLKLDVDYFNDSNLGMKNFYDFFEIFGSIYYKIDDVWYLQSSGFEELKSKKIDNMNNVYIGINSNIISASEIKLIFNIRHSKYEYILK